MQISRQVPALNIPHCIEAGSQAQDIDDLGQKLLEWLCLFCAVVLLIVWPLPDTIAARNSALVLGCFSSLWWVYRTKLKLSFQMLLPSLCLLAVPAWLWIHYFFLPTDTEAQLYDLKGTWLRVILAVVMAGGLGLMISKRPKRIYWIWAAMTILGIVSLVNFAREALIAHQWIFSDYRFPFKYKSAVVYFLMYPCLFAYAILHSTLINLSRQQKNKNQHIALGVLGLFVVIVCWLDFINAHALNGILVAIVIAMFLLFACLRTGLQTLKMSFKGWILMCTLFFFLVAAFTIFWQYDQKHEKKLTNLVGDMKIAVQLDRYTAWNKHSYNTVPLPVDSSGRVVNGSTYERTAWFVKGVDILRNNPLGSGFSHLSFQYFMRLEHPSSYLLKTHSGWLDLALGIGLPGLALTWLGMFLVFKRSIKEAMAQNYQQLSLQRIALWIIGGIWVLWWPAEVSEREFIEQLFFMIALLSTATFCISRKAVN